MKCDYLKECGSCTLFLPYNEQILFKLNYIKDKFSQFFNGNFEFFDTNESHYRTRAEFGIWHDEDKIYYTMNSTKKGMKIFIDNCPKVCLEIYNIMPKLLCEIKKNKNLKEKLFGVEFLSSTNEMLITLLYHKRLDDAFKSEILELSKAVNACIMARARGQKFLSFEPNLLDEIYVNSRKFSIGLSENAFTQPNRSVNEKMIGWATCCARSSGNKKDLLELYCGHGNFTIPLSFEFRQVLATEVSKSSIANAVKNCRLNNAQNLEFVRLSADELMSAFNKEREFNRLKSIDIFSYDFSHILVDPPRAGLEMSVINFIKNYENIIYISCNPQSLFENLKQLAKTHEVIRFAIFDQFANTHHIECGVFLRKKNAR